MGWNSYKYALYITLLLLHFCLIFFFSFSSAAETAALPAEGNQCLLWEEICVQASFASSSSSPLIFIGRGVLRDLDMCGNLLQEFLRETLFPHYILCTPFFIAPESDHWQPLSVTHSVTFSRLDWCDPGLLRCQLKSCWGCYCWWRGWCCQKFVADLEAEVWS